MYGCQRRVAEMSSDSFWDGSAVPRVAPEMSATDRSQFGGSSRTRPGRCHFAATGDTLPPGLAEHPDYEIIRELGRGGMGVVYLARNKLMGRLEVLKVVGGHLVERPGVRDRFLREVQSAAKLQHKNIVTAYAAMRFGESIALAMEYVEGDDLAKVVKSGGPLPVVNACYFIYQAALGLQHAHERGMVHRDIKPANLIFAVRQEGRRQGARLRPGQGDQRGPGRQRPDPRRPDAGHAGLYRPRTDPQRPVGRHPGRHLQPRLYFLLPPDRRTAVPGDHLWDLYQAHFSMDAGSAEPRPPRGPGRAGRLGGQDDGEGAGPAVSDPRRGGPGADAVLQEGERRRLAFRTSELSRRTTGGETGVARQGFDAGPASDDLEPAAASPAKKTGDIGSLQEPRLGEP